MCRIDLTLDFFTKLERFKSIYFPPFSIVGRVLAKIKQDEAEALVIVPCWQTRPWFPQLVEIVKPGTLPIKINANKHLLTLPGTNFIHPLHAQLNLVAAILSGICQQKTYHQRLQISSLRRGDLVRNKRITNPTMAGILWKEKC